MLNNNQQGVRCECDLVDLAQLAKVVLIPPGSITHHSDMTARYVETVSTTVSNTARDFDTPGQTVLPKGYYMLFALTNANIPSEAIWVRVQ